MTARTSNDRMLRRVSRLPRTANLRRGTAAGLFASALVVVLAVAGHAAGDAAVGRQKAFACQTCHGLDGLSKLPEAPSLAGQPEPYLIKALNDYRTGARQNDMMSLVVPALSDQDAADLAAYYAGIEIDVRTVK